MVVFGQRWLYSGNVVVMGESGCFRANDCTQAKWLYSSKMVEFGLSGCIWANMVLFGQSGYIRVKWLYWGNVVLFRKSSCI